jgi:hypothetical protein
MTARDPIGEHAKAKADKQKPKIEFLSDEDLFTEEAPDANLVVPALGIGSGPVNILAGTSFVGKTLMAMSMGLAIGTGRRVWGKYAVRQGLYIHLDYEQGKSETKRRIRRLAMGMGIRRDELRDKVKVSIFPVVNLTTEGAVDAYAEAMTGARIIVVDSLKVCTPGEDENSSNLRDLIRVLTKASEKTGCAVLLIHHTPKNNPEDLRGSGGIREEGQTVFIVVGQAHSKVKTVKNTKNRPHGENLSEFGLQFVTPADGEFMFEPVADDEEGMTIGKVPPPASPLAVEVASLDTVHVERLLAYLGEHGGFFEGSETALAKEAGGNKQAVLRAIRALKEGGRVVRTANPAGIKLTTRASTPSGTNGVAPEGFDDHLGV